MKIKPLKAFSDNYIWLILTDGPFFDCVDPGDASPILSFIQQTDLELRNIYLTHHHFDHQGGVRKLKERFNDIMVYGPDDSRIDILDRPVKENDLIDGGEYQLKVLETPGHTSTHICYLDENNAWLFCGDTLFSAGCGRVFDGSHQQLFQSLLKLKALDEDTKVYCAHEYTMNNLNFAKSIEPDNQQIEAYRNSLSEHHCSLPSTIALEKEVNPFMRLDKNSIKNFARAKGVDSEDRFAVFHLLRDLKDKF